MSIQKIDKTNFESVVINSSKPVLLDFWADWCGPCQMAMPIVNEIAEENPQYLIGKINVDEEPELAQTFNIMSIPTFMVIKNGRATEQAVGLRSKEQLLKMFEG